MTKIVSFATKMTNFGDELASLDAEKRKTFDESSAHIRKVVERNWNRKLANDAKRTRPLGLHGSFEEAIWAASYAAEPFFGLNGTETRIRRANAAIMEIRGLTGDSK